MTRPAPDALTKAHRLALLVGLKQAAQRLDAAIVKAAEACSELLHERQELRRTIETLEEALQEDR